MHRAWPWNGTIWGPRGYTVETTSTLPAASWTPVPGVTWPIRTNNVVLALPGQSSAFFRYIRSRSPRRDPHFLD